jgi:FKBP-type peptidyl-prolyl cis-trans isomerase
MVPRMKIVTVGAALVVALGGLGGLGLSACSKKSGDTGSSSASSGAAAPQQNGSGLMIEEVKAGDGALATKGKTVSVHYTGTLTNGTKFDSSHDRGQPIEFVLGAGMVIKGWDQGIDGMKVGGKRKLTIPPELGYGARGTPGGPIPPNATLVFDVELVAVK